MFVNLWPSCVLPSPFWLITRKKNIATKFRKKKKMCSRDIVFALSLARAAFLVSFRVNWNASLDGISYSLETKLAGRIAGYVPNSSPFGRRVATGRVIHGS